MPQITIGAEFMRRLQEAVIYNPNNAFGYPNGSVSSATPQTSVPALNVTQRIAFQPLFSKVVSPHSTTQQTGTHREFSELRIMKGVMPTDFSTLTDVTSRSEDILLTYRYHPTVNDFIALNTGLIPSVISTILKAADASGTASWCWILTWVTIQTSSGTTVSAPIHQIIGDVGLPASGAALEISSTNIVAGANHDCVFRMTLPEVYNY